MNGDLFARVVWNGRNCGGENCLLFFENVALWIVEK
jgi:hypothetical protein